VRRSPRVSLLLACALSGVLLALPRPATAADGPSLFLNATEISEIRGVLHQKREPWYSVYQSLLKQCDGFLLVEPNPVKGRFVYRPPLPLLSEAMTGLAPGDADYMRRDSRIVRDLGLGYALSGNEAYAQKAVAFVTAWAGAMQPAWPADGKLEAAMAMNTSLPAMLYGYDLLSGSAARTEEVDRQVRTWASALLDSCKTGYSAVSDAQSIPWNMTFYCAAAVVSGRTNELAFVYGKTKNEDTFQSLYPLVFEKSGSLNRSYATSSFGGQDIYDGIHVLKAFSYVAEVARHQGTDLYNWVGNGRGLRKSYTAYAAYFNGKKPLAGVKSFPLGRDLDAAIYEIAYAIWPEVEFEKVIQYLDRPGYDPDILGPVCLTHRYRGGRDKPAAGAPSDGSQPGKGK
jgi:hypothetical protein